MPVATGPSTAGQPSFCAWNTDFTPSAAWPPAPTQANHPVVWVDWCDAFAYCAGAGKRLCGPLSWRDRPDFTCFQAGSETAAIARGVATELGPLANTQARPEVGPYAEPGKH